MGNTQNEDKFDPKMVEEYNKKQNQIQGHYHSHQLQAPGAFAHHQTQSKSVNMLGIKRELYLFKPSIDFDILPNKQDIKMHYDYHSSRPCFLEIYLGVKNINRDNEGNYQNRVDCLWKNVEQLPPIDKKHEEKIYNVPPNIINQILNYGILLVISQGAQRAEYSMVYMKNTKIWKVLVETYEKNGQKFGIQDIYGGGSDGQQCIICFTDPSNTMVKPCNHLCLCKECSEIVRKQSNNCPICRKKILELVTLNKS